MNTKGAGLTAQNVIRKILNLPFLMNNLPKVLKLLWIMLLDGQLHEFDIDGVEVFDLEIRVFARNAVIKYNEQLKPELMKMDNPGRL